MELTEVARALRRFWWLALTIVVLVVAAGYVASKRGSSQQFAATATVSVSANPAIGNSYDSVRFQLPVIVERIGSRGFRQSLAGAVSAEALDSVTEISASSEVPVIVEITARGTDRNGVADVANAAATALIDHYTPLQSLDATTAATGGPVVIEVISEAVPDRPAGDSRTTATLLASVVLGAIVAVGAVVLVQRWSRSRHVATRVREQLGVPVLAVIPVARRADGDVELARIVATASPMGNALHDLRSSIETRLDSGARLFAVTSWRRDDRSATLAAGLALTFAAVGRDTVAVDADVAHPELAERLGGTPEAGQTTQPTPHQGVRVATAGSADRHPAQVLAGALPAILAEVTASFPDAVAILAAPALDGERAGPWVGIPAETAVALRAAGQAVVAIDAAMRDLEDVATALDELRESGVTVIGVAVRDGRRTRRR